MFSTDKNVNTIAEMIQHCKKYAEMRIENAERGTVDKLTAVMTGMIIGAIILLALMVVILFLSAAAVFALAPHIGGYATATLTVGLFHLCVLTLIFIKRKQWISTPISKALSLIFLGDKATQAAPDAEKMAELEHTIAMEYQSLTKPTTAASNNLERAVNAASRAWAITDGIMLGYKLYKKLGRKRSRHSRW